MSAETWTPKPVRGYSWPPFEKGNTIALRHGARSRRIYEPLAADLAAGLLEVRPDLEDFPDAVAAWAESEARAELLRKYITDQTLFDGKGDPRSGVLQWLRTFETQAESARRTLGLDPRSSAELTKLRAEATGQVFDIDALMASGREARLAAEERLALSTAQDGQGEPGAPADGDQHHDIGSEAHSASATDPTSGAHVTAADGKSAGAGKGGHTPDPVPVDATPS